MSPRNGHTNNTNIIYLPFFFPELSLTNMATSSSVFRSCHCCYFRLFMRSSLIILVTRLPLNASSNVLTYLCLILSVVCASVRKYPFSLMSFQRWIPKCASLETCFVSMPTSWRRQPIRTTMTRVQIIRLMRKAVPSELIRTFQGWEFLRAKIIFAGLSGRAF